MTNPLVLIVLLLLSWVLLIFNAARHRRYAGESLRMRQEFDRYRSEMQSKVMYARKLAADANMPMSALPEPTELPGTSASAFPAAWLDNARGPEGMEIAVGQPEGTGPGKYSMGPGAHPNEPMYKALPGWKLRPNMWY